MARIYDYALIGDCRSAALVSTSGSVDWLAWPRIDSPALFAAVLDPRAGHWSIRPRGVTATSRRYVDATNVLETRFVTETGAVTITDFMPVAHERDLHAMLTPEHELVRAIACDGGEVDLDIELDVRPDYGRVAPRVHDGGKLGIRIELPRGVLYVRSDIVLAIHDDAIRGCVRLRAGDRRAMSLVHALEHAAVLRPLGAAIDATLDRTIRWWLDWIGRFRYAGPERDAVIRSALVLKLLNYAPSGAIVAAPTTSLPERLGGTYNWDYRYAWLRDASLTARALAGLGFEAEAEAFVGWLVHNTRLTHPALRTLYDIYGNRPPREHVLDWLDGFAGSRPVRVGNAAVDQLQLDIYGEVVDAASKVLAVEATDRETARLLLQFGEHVCRSWRQPDEGIWEPRSGRAHHTHSRLLCWTALDRLVELHATGRLPNAPVDRFRAHREAIRAELVFRAWNQELKSYTSTLDGTDVDASLLLMSWYGFEKPDSARMRATYDRLYRELGVGNGLLRRYHGPDVDGEGAFGMCGFWAAEYLALGGGSVDEAARAFSRLCRLGNDLGLYAEEVDPATGQGLGNFPQAFTHVGLINAALSLTHRLRVEGASP